MGKRRKKVDHRRLLAKVHTPVVHVYTLTVRDRRGRIVLNKTVILPNYMKGASSA